jgi:hypothetical protein
MTRTGRGWSILALLAAISSPAAADDTSEMWRTAEAYIVCGRDYVKTALRPTLEAAQAECSKQLDAYGMAMHTLALNTQIAEGRPLEAARSFAVMKETWTFSNSVDSFGSLQRGAHGGERRRPAHDAALRVDHRERRVLELGEVALGRIFD